MRYWVLLCLLLAGCVDTEAPRVTSTDFEPGPRPADQEEQVRPEPEAQRPKTADPEPYPVHALPTDTKTFSWQGHGSLGDVAIEVTIDFGVDNACTLTHTARGYAADTSLYNAVVYAGDDPWWLIESDVVIAHGRAGSMDTEQVTAGYDDRLSTHRYDTSYSHHVTMRDVVRITHLGNGVGANEAAPMTGPTLSIDINCDQSFDVQGAWLGRDILLRDVQAMQDGAAAHTVLVADASVGSTATVDLTGEHVRIMALRGYSEASQVTVQGPAGETSWLMTPDDWARVDTLDSRPGQHTITVDRVNAGYGAFSLAAYGLQEPLDLDPGLWDP